MIKKKGTELAIAKSLLDNWSQEMNPEEIKELRTIALSKSSVSARLKIVMSRKFVTGNLSLTIAGKMKLLFGLL